MRLYVIALASLGLASCVTSGDIRDIANQIENVERVANDNTATADQVELAVQNAATSIEAIAQRVDERTEGFIEGVGQTGEAGILSMAAAAGLHFYRNSRRRKREEPV